MKQKDATRNVIYVKILNVAMATRIYKKLIKKCSKNRKPICVVSATLCLKHIKFI